ncbi:conserved hypothetical protein, partial [Ricinus communis]
MAQEEEPQKCSNSNSGGGGSGVNLGNSGIKSSKKQKQKKVPQRGLGVAQLEKIRLEEQRKKDGSMLLTSKTPISSSPPKTSINHHSSSVTTPNYYYHHHPSYSSPSSIPNYPSDITSSPNSSLKPQSFDVLNSNITALPLNNPLGWQSVSVHQGHGNVTKIWNSSSDQYNLENENHGVDPRLAFRSSLNLPYESNPIWPLQSLIERTQYQPPPPSLVNASSINTAASLLNLHMELPSNQNYYGNYTPIWPEEEKMVGIKRPYPFSQDNPPFHCKIPTIIHPIGRSDDSTSFGNGSIFNLTTPTSPNFRDGTLCSDSMSEPKPNSKKNNTENEDFNGDFLTLAPPVTTLSCPNSKLERSSPAHLTYQNETTFDFDSLPYQGIIENPMLQPGASATNQLQPYYSFLPPAILQIGQATRTINNYNGGE